MESWVLQAVDLYCTAVSSLGRELAQLDSPSRGMTKLLGYLTHYVASPAFSELVSGSQQVHEARCTSPGQTTATTSAWSSQRSRPAVEAEVERAPTA